MNIEIQRPVAHCTKDMADWLDPEGALQKAGLLVVDMAEPEPSPRFVQAIQSPPKEE